MTHPRPTKAGPQPQRNGLAATLLSLLTAPVKMLRKQNAAPVKRLSKKTRTKEERRANRLAHAAQASWEPITYHPSRSSLIRNKRIRQMVSRTKRGVRN